MKTCRRKLPVDRTGLTHKFTVGTGDGALTVYVQTGQYIEGTLGEVFLKADKQGTLVSGLVESFSVIMSLAIQHGVPLEVIADKLKNTRFAPEGAVVGGVSVTRCTSVVDYLMRWLESHYKEEKQDELEPR